MGYFWLLNFSFSSPSPTIKMEIFQQKKTVIFLCCNGQFELLQNGSVAIYIHVCLAQEPGWRLRPIAFHPGSFNSLQLCSSLWCSPLDWFSAVVKSWFPDHLRAVLGATVLPSRSSPASLLLQGAGGHRLVRKSGIIPGWSRGVFSMEKDENVLLWNYFLDLSFLGASVWKQSLFG